MEIDAKYLLRQQEQEEQKEKEEKNKLKEESKINSVIKEKNFEVVSSCYLEINTTSALSKSSPLFSFASTSNDNSNFQFKNNETTDSKYHVEKIYDQEIKVN